MILPRGATGADFSPDRAYRYRLWRIWDARLPLLALCMLNPSTADEFKNDPTVRRCESWAFHWGYGGLVVVNLFALRSTDPRRLFSATDPVGPENDAAILRAAGEARHLICAWGVHGAFRARGEDVQALLSYHDKVYYALGFTKDGHPRHPLYLPSSTTPVPWGHGTPWERPGPDPAPRQQQLVF